MEARHLDIQGNIYAFGILVLEIVSGRPPYCEDRGYLLDWVRTWCLMTQYFSSSWIYCSVTNKIGLLRTFFPLLLQAREYLEFPEALPSVVDPELKHFKLEDLIVICEVVNICIQPSSNCITSMQDLCAKLESGIDTSVTAELRASSLAWAELALSS